MHPPTKDQTDIGVDNPTIDCSEPRPDGSKNEDMARQEFKDEADINYMLTRFGITQPRGAPTYGEWDDSIDLQTAIESVREAREGYKTLPEEMRDKFKSMEDMLTAIDNGSLVIKDGDIPEPKPTPEQLLQKRIDTLEQRLSQTQDSATQSENA